MQPLLPEYALTITQMSSLHEERLDHTLSVLLTLDGQRLLDLGCGQGALLYRVLREPKFTEVLGLEYSALTLSATRSMLAEHLTAQGGSKPRLRLLCGSYAERNDALVGFDIATMIETIEHVPPRSLSAVEAAVFGQYRPRTLYMTTPNQEYNVLFDLAPGEFRDPDHCFEWTRAKFRDWASGVARRNGYGVRFGGIGDADEAFGPPSQTALFSRLEARV